MKILLKELGLDPDTYTVKFNRRETSENSANSTIVISENGTDKYVLFRGSNHRKIETQFVGMLLGPFLNLDMPVVESDITEDSDELVDKLRKITDKDYWWIEDTTQGLIDRNPLEINKICFQYEVINDTIKYLKNKIKRAKEIVSQK